MHGRFLHSIEEIGVNFHTLIRIIVSAKLTDYEQLMLSRFLQDLILHLDNVVVVSSCKSFIRSNDNGTYLSFLFWNLFPHIKIPVLDLRNMPQDSGNLSLKSVKVRL